ncbi:t-SNARE [Dacryopinax primogenitus]|uniref:t-SNARE n=1 Tax=Dacryopinax primogenitus (strain DJM 731) TaxID=1858805 RepID=M5FYB5_DACPD|nr:t-SNARE [Dacryopinax primogenitus]EJU03046.1 t-SNARE [Dacryopinax primogenitus]
MSFNDLERGIPRAPAPTSSTSPLAGDASSQFQKLQSSLSLQMFKINANVQGMLKLVDQLGTNKDGNVVRKGLHELTEATRELVKRSTADLKTLTELQHSLPDKKLALSKTSADLQSALVAYQHAQKLSAEKQRTVVDSAKRTVSAAGIVLGEEGSGPDDGAGETGRLLAETQEQIQAHAPQISMQELQFQESLIAEREADIQEIETGIHELNEIFRDLGTLVVEQGGMLDNIERNITAVARDTAGADEELRTASEYQRKAGRRACWLLIIISVVICIVLLAILS